MHSGYEFGEPLAGRCGLTSNDYGFDYHTVNRHLGAEHMDWLFGTMDSWAAMRDGYLKSRRADTARRGVPHEGRRSVFARTACDITLHALR